MGMVVTISLFGLGFIGVEKWVTVPKLIKERVDAELADMVGQETVNHLRELQAEFAELGTAKKVAAAAVQDHLFANGTAPAVDREVYGNFEEQWFDFKCDSGKVMVGYGVRISAPFIVVSSGDNENKRRVALAYRLICAPQ